MHVVTAGKIWSDLFGPQSQWISMTVPAILYLIQNNLQYIAVGLLDAATFQVAYQLKILTTALFSVLLLSRSLSLQKWMALVMLTIGVAIVQTAGTKSAAAEHSSKLLGLAVVFCACCTSGLAGVWFERVLKGSTSSLYLRNVQMSLFSIIPGIFSGIAC